MHMLCINVVRRVIHLDEGLIIFMLALPLSIALATLSFHFFETPFLRLKTRLPKQRKDEAAKARAAGLIPRAGEL
jgi:peptidoglycan/LPS O-acetylase OafA/YrhL